MNKVTPYNSIDSKKKQIIRMFDNISRDYDFLNNFLTFGMHGFWRKKAVRSIQNKPKSILDIATGTADFAISAAKYTDAMITGIDISQQMLDQAEKKIKKRMLSDRICLQLADSEELPFIDASFDAVIAGFGVRNFENLQEGLKEMFRVLKKEGVLVILEPSIPNRFVIKQLHVLYFNYILPVLGALISRDKNAYSYLSQSVNAFPSGNKFIVELEKAGFKKGKSSSLTFGVVSLYTAIK